MSSASGATPRLKSSLERALLRAFADVGPNLTALGACPSAPFVCNGDKHRAAAGWWILFACDVTVTCEMNVAVDGQVGDVAELRLVPSGEGVMEGLTWSWRLMLVRKMAIGRRDEAALLMTDGAPYPEPMSNLVTYHSLSVCRDELCSRVARELNARCDAAFEGRSLAGFAMDLAWGSLTSVFDTGKSPPQDDEKTQATQEEAMAQAAADVAAAQEAIAQGISPVDPYHKPCYTPLPQHQERHRSVVDKATRKAPGSSSSDAAPAPRVNGHAPLAHAPGRPAVPVAALEAARGGAGGVGLQALAENEVLACFDPPSSSAGLSLGIGLEGASLPGEQSGSATPGVAPAAAAQAAAQARKPGWVGKPATAELFSDFLSYRSPRVEPPPQLLASGEEDPPIAADADFEDTLDILRGKLPDRSSQELRKLLLQANGDVAKVVAMFA